jgi:hypothetical protein
MRRVSLTYAERRIATAAPAITLYAAADAAHRYQMYRDAYERYTEFRRIVGGYKHGARFTTPGQAQHKLSLSGIPTTGIMLLPARQSTAVAGARINVCPAATACAHVCLVSSGKGGMSSVRAARAVRTMFLFDHPADAMVMALHEALKARMHRPNVTSDLRWELALPEYVATLQREGIRVYDYTKYAPRLRGDLYHLTWSATERMSVDDIRRIVGEGRNVAVVFAESKRTVLAAVEAGFTWHGMRLIDGISTDDRTSDELGVIVALSALGEARRDRSGFVRQLGFVA